MVEGAAVDAGIGAALEYARKHGLHAMLVVRERRTLHEAYASGYDADKPHALYSGTKSFWGVAATIAEREGLLGIDETVAETFPEWRKDKWKKRVTLRNLLQLTSGIRFGGLGQAVPTYEKALAADLKDEPGTRFTYGGIPLQVFGAVFARKLQPAGLTPHEYLARRVFDPIGMKVSRWRTLADGTHPLPTGAFLAAREWAKYGQFMLDEHQRFVECFMGSRANPRYGLGWWLNPQGAPPGAFYASGSAGQALYVIPSQAMVVVHFGDSSSFKHEAFLKRLFASNC